MPAKKAGLYANIHAKQERIAHGSGEKMRKPGAAGAPKDEAFDKAEKTAKKPTAHAGSGKATASKSGSGAKTTQKTTATKKSPGASRAKGDHAR